MVALISKRHASKNPEDHDFFPTPDWAVDALVDAERPSTFSGGNTIWDPACGDGQLSRRLEHHGFKTLNSDIVDRGHGHTHDFLQGGITHPTIVTNPPYHLAEEFVHEAWRSSKYFAFLLRLSFLEGSGRHNSLFTKTPPASILVFSSRLTMYRPNVERAGTSGVAYAWFVWRPWLRDTGTTGLGPPGPTITKWLKPKSELEKIYGPYTE